MLDELLKDNKLFQSNLKEILSKLMRGLVEKDKNEKKEVGIYENENEELVDMLVEMILNTSLKPCLNT